MGAYTVTNEDGCIILQSPLTHRSNVWAYVILIYINLQITLWCTQVIACDRGADQSTCGFCIRNPTEWPNSSLLHFHFKKHFVRNSYSDEIKILCLRQSLVDQEQCFQQQKWLCSDYICRTR